MSTALTHPLAGRHALITGGGSGIGAAIARQLVAAGANVTVMGRRQDVLHALVATAPDQFHAVVADVTDAMQVTRCVCQRP